MAKKLKFDDIEEYKEEVKDIQEKELGTVVEIPIDLIDIGENIRNVDEDDESKLRQLGESIKTDGQIEPCIVYQSGKRYVLKAGSRRYKACVLSDIDVLKCIIDKKFKDEKERIIYQATENEHRDDMNPREREKYMARLLDLGMSQVEIARALHKNKGWVSEALTAHNMLEENKALSEVIGEDVSTRDIWNASRLSEEELTEVTNAVKEKGGTKKAFKEELKKKINAKKEKEDSADEELNTQINETFGIEFDIDDSADETVENKTLLENTESESDEYTLGLHYTFKINDKIKKAVYTGDEKNLESDIEKYTLTQIKNYYLSKGYIVD